MRRRAAAVLCGLGLAACGGPHGDPVRFTVPEGSGLGVVADTLSAREIVPSATAFRLYARVRGQERSIKPGTYELRRGTPWSEVLGKLVAGDVVTIALVVPEGWTVAEIAPRVAAATDTSADSLRTRLLSEAWAESLGVPGPTLEGYLYPATYRFPLGIDPERVIGTMVARYRQLWTPELRARADSLELDEREVVTLASIIEKEARRWEERDTISAVYHNRLRIGMALQADPTVQYALGEHRSRLLYSDIDDMADHPYNTYTHAGLPPGPIASPSAEAIRAALYPADVDFLYFVARADGGHVFTRTLAEHNAARRRIRAAADGSAPDS